MRKGTLVVFGLISIVVAFVMWRLIRPSDPGATGDATQGQEAIRPIPSTPKSKAGQTPAKLVVTVSDAKGVLAKARVRIAPKAGEVLVLETNQDGIAQEQLAPGTYTVSASAADHEPVAPPEVNLEPGETEKLSIVLAAGGRSLTGVVTDVSGGPIAGARIDAAKLGGMARPGTAVATTFTGTDGRYALTVSEGQLLVAARSPDYAAQSRYVDVGASGATADFALVPGGVVEGIVLDDRTKQPVGGAHVHARRDSASILLAEAGAHTVTAGDDGRFRITGLRPGAYELDAQHEHRRSKAPTIVGLGVAEQITDVTILVGKGAVVRGTVVDDKGAGVANAKVRAIGRSRGGATATSDAKGAFVLEGLDAGGHFLIASSDTHVTAGGTAIELADKDLDGITVRVKRGEQLKGHVEPRQAGCEVRIEPARMTKPGGGAMLMITLGAPIATNDRGEFETGPLLAESLAIEARCASGDQGSLAIEWDGVQELVVEVKPGASIAGKVLDAERKPIAGAIVMASARGRDGQTTRTTIVNGVVTSGVKAVTNAAGAYELVGLEAGTYHLAVLERGRPLRAKTPIAPVTLTAAERKTGVDLEVDRSNGVIEGVVTGPDGKPLADAWVSVHQDLESLIAGATGRGRPGRNPGPAPDVGNRRAPETPGGGSGSGASGPPRNEGESRMVISTNNDDGGGANEYPPVLTDAQGRFQITGLPHLAFDVVAEARAGKLRGRADNITPDAKVAIKALGVTSLSGTVRGANGPATLFTVEVEGPTRTQRTFTDGTFTIGRVDPGTYTLRVRSSDGNATTSVTVAPNTPTTVDIMLIANAVVVGTVVDAAGKPLADIPIHITDDQPEGMLTVSISGPPPTSGPDGKFRIEHKAGKAMLIVLSGSPPIAKRGLVLEAGKTLDVGTIQVDP